ncbi:Cadherin-8 [Blastocladiella emersonii ATCC 22665]|nr:Cadherin-8 [Blastocladiella emersonii ATCC 22665]
MSAFADRKCDQYGLPAPDEPYRNALGQPVCGIKNATSVCLADQCCSYSGFCGPFAGSDGNYNENGKAVSKADAIAAYCETKPAGDWRNWTPAGKCGEIGGAVYPWPNGDRPPSRAELIGRLGNGKKGGLSLGAIVGLVAVGVAVIGAIAGVVAMRARRRRSNHGGGGGASREEAATGKRTGDDHATSRPDSRLLASSTTLATADPDAITTHSPVAPPYSNEPHDALNHPRRPSDPSALPDALLADPRNSRSRRSSAGLASAAVALMPLDVHHPPSADMHTPRSPVPSSIAGPMVPSFDPYHLSGHTSANSSASRSDGVPPAVPFGVPPPLDAPDRTPVSSIPVSVADPVLFEPPSAAGQAAAAARPRPVTVQGGGRAMRAPVHVVFEYHASTPLPAAHAPGLPAPETSEYELELPTSPGMPGPGRGPAAATAREGPAAATTEDREVYLPALTLDQRRP